MVRFNQFTVFVHRSDSDYRYISFGKLRLQDACRSAVARLGVDQRMYFINEENRIAVSRQFFDDSFQPFFYLPFVGSTRNQCSCVKLIDSHVL